MSEIDNTIHCTCCGMAFSPNGKVCQCREKDTRYCANCLKCSECCECGSWLMAANRVAAYAERYGPPTAKVEPNPDDYRGRK